MRRQSQRSHINLRVFVELRAPIYSVATSSKRPDIEEFETRHGAWERPCGDGKRALSASSRRDQLMHRTSPGIRGIATVPHHVIL